MCMRVVLLNVIRYVNDVFVWVTWSQKYMHANLGNAFIKKKVLSILREKKIFAQEQNDV